MRPANTLDASRAMTARLFAQREPTAQPNNDLHEGLMFTP